MKTIAWDVDDVLNDLMRTWLQRVWIPTCPGCSIRYEQIIENPPHALLGISRAEYLASLDDFRLSPTAAELPPLPEVLGWFVEHGQRARHLAITAAPLEAAPASAAWVMRHFGHWIRSFHFIPSFREGENLPIYDRCKAEMLKHLGQVDILIDDNSENLTSAQALGVRTLQIPRPWNGCSMPLSQTLRQLTQWISE